MNARQQFISFKTLLRKEVVRCLRIWPQTLVPPAITMTLYFLVFGKLVGSQLHTINGYTYMQYIVPGLIMMAVIMNSYINSSSSFFGMKFQKSIEEILVSPTPNHIILWGFIAGSTLRAFLVGTIVLFIAFLFTHVPIHYPIMMVAITLITAIFFAIAGLMNGIFARNFDDVSWVPSFVLTPLTYLGGVFFSIHMLSPLWQHLALLNPIFYIVDIFRYSLLGIHETNIDMGLLALGIMTIILFCYTLYLLRTSLRLRS